MQCFYRTVHCSVKRKVISIANYAIMVIDSVFCASPSHSQVKVKAGYEDGRLYAHLTVLFCTLLYADSSSCLFSISSLIQQCYVNPLKTKPAYMRAEVNGKCVL